MSNIFKVTFNFSLKNEKDKANCLEEIIRSKTNGAINAIAFISVNRSYASTATENDGITSIFLDAKNRSEDTTLDDTFLKFKAFAKGDDLDKDNSLDFIDKIGARINKGSIRDSKLIIDFLSENDIGIINTKNNILLATVDDILYMPLSILKKSISFSIDIMYTNYNDSGIKSYYKNPIELPIINTEEQKEEIEVEFNENFYSELLGIKKVISDPHPRSGHNLKDYGDCEIRSLYNICPSDQQNWEEIHHNLNIIGENLKLQINSPSVLTEFIHVNIKDVTTIEFKDITRYRTIGEFLYDNKKGTFIVSSSDHIFAYIDGVWYDNEYRHSIENHILFDEIDFVISIKYKNKTKGGINDDSQSWNQL